MSQLQKRPSVRMYSVLEIKQLLRFARKQGYYLGKDSPLEGLTLKQLDDLVHGVKIDIRHVGIAQALGTINSLIQENTDVGDAQDFAIRKVRELAFFTLIAMGKKK